MLLKNEITVPVSAWTVSGGRIPLGYVGESNVERVIFDFSEDLPAAVYRIEIKDRSRSGWHLLSIEGRTAVFDVPADILLFSGAVDLQIVAVAEGATVKKSNVFSGYVYGSVQAGEEVPPEEISAFEQALAEYNEKLMQAIDAAESAAQSAADAVQSASEARSAEIGATMAANAADLSHRDAEAVKESVKTLEGAAESARDDAARNAITASGFADAAERAKVDAQESARKAQQSATESARHASDSASSAELAGRSVEAIRSMSADAETLEPGSEATASYDIGANRLHFGIPKGLKGDKGDTGARGADGVNGINGRDGRDGTNGRDGVDGRTPVKGTDYFTSADIDEVVQETLDRVPPYTLPQAGTELGGVKAGSATTEDNAPVNVTEEGYMRVKVPPAYDDTAVKADIESIESKKVGYSEVADGKLMMYADDTKAVLLAEMDLPKATHENSLFGMLRINDGYGLKTILSEGQSKGITYINRAQPANIDTRTSSYLPIVPSNLDYAVKAALCDGKGPAYTEEDRIAACDRIGAVSKNTFELIEEVTVTSDTEEITVTIQPTENSSEKLIIQCYLAKTERGTLPFVAYINNTLEFIGYLGYSSNARGMYAIAELTRFNNFHMVECGYGDYSDYLSNQIKGVKRALSTGSYSVLRFEFRDSEAIPAGSVVRIYRVY